MAGKGLGERFRQPPRLSQQQRQPPPSSVRQQPVTVPVPQTEVVPQEEAVVSQPATPVKGYEPTRDWALTHGYIDYLGMPAEHWASVAQEGKPYVQIKDQNEQVVTTMLAEDWDKQTPEKQLVVMKQAGQVPAEAVLTESDGGLRYTLPSSTKYQLPTGATELSKSELDYIRKNDPDLYQSIRDEGLTEAWQKYADRITEGQLAARLTPEQAAVYRQAGGGQSGVDAVNAMPPTTVTAVSRRRIGGHEVDTALEDYRTDGGYDIARFLRDNNDNADALTAANFPKSAIDEARDYNSQPWRRVNATDIIYSRAYKAGLKLDSTQTPEEVRVALARDPGIVLLSSIEPKAVGLKAPMSQRAFTSAYVDARIGQPEYASLGKLQATLVLKDAATREYIRLYGKGTTMASEGTDVLSVVVPAARVMQPEVVFRDISGAEWAESAANVALLALSPVLGKTGSAVVRGVGKAVTYGAAATYPVVTAVQWRNMSPVERVINVAIDATIAAAVFGRPVGNTLKNLNPGIGLPSRINGLAKAVRTGDATAVWVAGNRLEAYGEALERSGVLGGSRLKAHGAFVKGNARTLASRTLQAGGSSSQIDSVISDLRGINTRMSLVSQRGSMAIDARTGKIIDTETGQELTPQRQMERIRQIQTAGPTVLPVTRADIARLGLTETELSEIAQQAGGNRQLFLKLAEEKAAQKAAAIRKWNAALEKASRQIEAQKASAEGMDAEWAARYGEESGDFNDTLRQLREMDAEVASREASRLSAIDQAARQARQEAAYARLFPSSRVVPFGGGVSALTGPMERRADSLQFIEVYRDADGRETYRTYWLPIPALKVGWTEAIQEMSLDDMKFSTEAQEQAFRKQLTDQATKTVDKLRQKQEPVSLTSLRTSTNTKTDTKLRESLATALSQQAASEIETKTSTETKPATDTATKTETATETETKTQTATQLQRLTDTQTDTQTETETAAETEVAAEQATSTEPVTDVKVEPVVESPMTEPPTEEPFERPPEGETVIRPPTVVQGTGVGYGRQRVPGGSLAWAQGSRKGVRGVLVPQWYYIPPEDFGRAVKPRSLSAPPQGAKNTDSVVPRETIQVIGRSRTSVPKRVTMDLGFADITIVDGASINFIGGGLKTDIGTRLSSNTKGMSVDENSDYLDSSETERVLEQGINRPKMSKKSPRRKGRRQDDFSSIVSIRGLRL